MKRNGLMALVLPWACFLIASCARDGGGTERHARRSTLRGEISGLTSNQVEIFETFGDTNPQARGDQVGGVLGTLGDAIESGCGTSRIDRISLEKLIGEPIDTIYSEPITVCASYEAGTQRNPSKVLVIIYENGYVRTYGSGDLLRNAP